MKFTKMHGIKNDYIYVNGFKENVDMRPEFIQRISDRHAGIGGDGMIVLLPSDICDFRMRMFNADGSEGKMCGNGIRCLAKFAYEQNMTTKTHLTFETLAGIKEVDLLFEDGQIYGAKVDMGEPILDTKLIPVSDERPQIVDQSIEINQQAYRVTCVSMGNPHCVLYVDDVMNYNVEGIGKQFEHSAIFPESVNTEFVQILEEGHLLMRVWERGSGETMACGTGACAVAVSYMLAHPDVKVVQVDLLGGTLEIEWLANGHIMMTGGATTVFEGNYEEREQITGGKMQQNKLLNILRIQRRQQL